MSCWWTSPAPRRRRGRDQRGPLVTLSAVFYVVRCLLADDQVPTNAGIFRPVRVVLPEGTLVNARFPAAVAAGNVETSQRIVDVLLGAFEQALPGVVPAASQGTMNNLTIGGDDPRTGGRFAYYETIAGGMGAAAGADGLSGVHVHMTNTLDTPAEAIEYAYPLRVTRYELRRGSGGAGRWRGGDGVYREIELLADATVTILSERRRHAPWGLAGGWPGAKGENRYDPADARGIGTSVRCQGSGVRGQATGDRRTRTRRTRVGAVPPCPPPGRQHARIPCCPAKPPSPRARRPDRHRHAGGRGIRWKDKWCGFQPQASGRRAAGAGPARSYRSTVPGWRALPARTQPIGIHNQRVTPRRCHRLKSASATAQVC